MQLKDGYCQQHYLYSGLCMQYHVNPIGRAILDHLQSFVDRFSAIRFTSSHALNSELNARNITAVKAAQKKLKSCGLLVYPTSSNTRHLYFLPLKIIRDGDNYRITRRWEHCIEIAMQNKIIQDPGELINLLVEVGHDWPDSNYRDLFSKPLYGATAAEYLELGAVPELTTKRRYSIDPEIRARRLKADAEQQARNMIHAQELMKRIQADEKSTQEPE